IDGIVRLCARGDADPTTIGNPKEFTVRQLAELVLRRTGSRSPIVERPLPIDDPKVRQPDIARARATLGWEPRISLDEGLQRTIEYFRTLVCKCACGLSSPGTPGPTVPPSAKRCTVVRTQTPCNTTTISTWLFHSTS